MHKMTWAPLTLAFLLVAAGTAHAHVTTTSDNTPSLVVPGQVHTFDWTASVSCAVVGPVETGEDYPEYHDGQELEFGIANHADFSWLDHTTETQTVEYAKCSDPTNAGTHPWSGTATFTVNATAPAFTSFNFQPGAVGEANEGGNFSVEIAYVPSFTAPTSLTFDAVGGGATATIPLTMTANANSVFNFDVISFTIDGETAPGSATAHIQDTLPVETGIFSENGSTAASVDLHFGVGDGGHGGHDMDEGMDPDEEHDDGETGMQWESAEAILSIALAAEQDTTQVSEPHLVTLTFNNADEPHVESEDDPDEDDRNFLPGFELPAAVAMLGAVAILRRRS